MQHDFSYLPALSQIDNVTDPEWRTRSCGAASAAMLIAWATRGKKTPSVDEVIEAGIKTEAYKPGTGWFHKGLVRIANLFGLQGQNFDWSTLSLEEAKNKLFELLEKQPLIASVTKEFSPSLDGHLIILKVIQDGRAAVHDPYRSMHQVSYEGSEDHFWKCWTKRVIIIEPHE